MKAQSLLFTAAVLGLTSVASANYSNSGNSSISIRPNQHGGHEITQVDTDFHIDAYHGRLYKTVTKTVQYTGAEGMMSEVEIEARKASANSLDFSQVLWKKTFKGSEFFQLNGDDFVAVRESGCCGSPDITRLINLNNGERVEAAAGEISQLDVPNSQVGHRYVSLVLNTKSPQTRDGRELIGTISYFNGTKILSRALIYAAMPAGYGGSVTDPKFLFAKGSRSTSERYEGELMRRVTLWDRDAEANPQKAFSRLFLSAEAWAGEAQIKFRLRIDGDKFTASQVDGSKALTIVLE